VSYFAEKHIRDLKNEKILPELFYFVVFRTPPQKLEEAAEAG